MYSPSSEPTLNRPARQAKEAGAAGQSHLEIRSQQNHRSCGTIKERSRIRGEIYRCRRAEITRLVHPGDASGDLAIKIKCVLVEKRSCISALFSNAIALAGAANWGVLRPKKGRFAHKNRKKSQKI
jgi:hypothetical protein